MSTQERIEDLKRDLEKLRYQQQPQAERATRGRDAEHPGKIPPGGWMDVLWRAWNEVSDANLFLVAGGVTYAVLLALFPGLAALVAIYGLVLDPSQVERQVSALSGVLPEESKQLLIDELQKLISTSSGTLGLSAAFGLVLALWSASRGMSGLITSLNIAYEEKERRGFFKLNLLALGLTVALVLGGLVVIALVAVLPAAVQLIGLRDATRWLLLGLEWPLLVVVVMFVRRCAAASLIYGLLVGDCLTLFVHRPCSDAKHFPDFGGTRRHHSAAETSDERCDARRNATRLGHAVEYGADSVIGCYRTGSWGGSLAR